MKFQIPNAGCGTFRMRSYQGEQKPHDKKIINNDSPLIENSRYAEVAEDAEKNIFIALRLSKIPIYRKTPKAINLQPFFRLKTRIFDPLKGVFARQLVVFSGKLM